MKKDKKDHCKKADCLYYDHKQYNNNCSASSTQHKLNNCRLYKKFKKIEENKLKNNHISIKRVVELMKINEKCEKCGNDKIGESRKLFVNEEFPGKEFIPFHIICSCGHEVKIYE